jgi:uncharacterized protein (TIGR03437 family)
MHFGVHVTMAAYGGATSFPPLFTSLDNGILATPNLSDFAAFTHAPCKASASLQVWPLTLPSPLQWNQSSGPLAPSFMNVGIVSPGPAVSNLVVSKDATWFSTSLNQTTTPATLTLIASPQPTGVYKGNVTVSSTQVPGSVVSIPVQYTSQPGPWFLKYEFANAGSYANAAVAPGETFVIFMHDAGPAALAGPTLGADGLAANLLGDTQVLFDGQPAALYYAATNQVAGFSPFSLAGKAQTKVQVVYKGVASPVVVLPVSTTLPALFTADNSGGGQGAILNQDGSPNGPSNPESPGNLVVLYGTGGGQTNPPGRDGAFSGVGSPLPTLNAALTVFIDGIQATDIPYAGPAPGLIEGVFQIDVRIPATVRRDTNVPVVVVAGPNLSGYSQPGVTIAIK